MINHNQSVATSNINIISHSNAPIQDPKLTSIWPLSTAWQGAFLKIMSYVCFAGINCIIRYWTGGSAEVVTNKLSVYELLFFQNVFAALFLFPWMIRFGWKGVITDHPKLNFLRITTAITGLGLWYIAIQYMPIAEGIAITFTGPIFAVIGARIFLKEKMSMQRLISVILSLVGAYIIIRPHNAFLNNSHGFGWYVLLPLGSAIALAFDKLYTRRIAKFGVKPEALVISFLMIMGPLSAILTCFSWVNPSPEHWKWLVLLGLLTACMHYCFVKAYMLAEVSFLTPIGFTKFFLSAGAAYLIFSELPKHWTFWLGSIVIFLSIILLVERPKQKNPERLLESPV